MGSPVAPRRPSPQPLARRQDGGVRPSAALGRRNPCISLRRFARHPADAPAPRRRRRDRPQISRHQPSRGLSAARGDRRRGQPVLPAPRHRLHGDPRGDPNTRRAVPCAAPAPSPCSSRATRPCGRAAASSERAWRPRPRARSTWLGPSDSRSRSTSTSWNGRQASTARRPPLATISASPHRN